MSIVRIERYSRFTNVPNETIEDERLSFRARGILVYLLSKPDHWTAKSEQLVAEGKEGRDAIRTALGELEINGYLERTRETYRAANGKRLWRTISVIHDLPKTGFQASDFQASENQASEVNTEQQILSSKGQKTTSSSPRRRSARRPSDTPVDQARLDAINEEMTPGRRPLVVESETRRVSRKKTAAPKEHIHNPRGRKAEHLACYWAVALERVGSLEAREEESVAFHFRRWLEMGLTSSLAKQMVDAFFDDPQLVKSNRRWLRFVKNIEMLRNRVSHGGHERVYEEPDDLRLPEWAREAMGKSA